MDYWKSSPKFDASSPEARALLPFFTEAATIMQYTQGVPEQFLSRIDPAAYALDSSLLQRTGQDIIQLSLFFDYRTNVEAYASWHEYFRKESPPLLAIWGKNDPIFLPEGAEAFKRDLKDAEVRFVDSGHFALETHVEEYGKKIDEFLTKVLD